MKLWAVDLTQHDEAPFREKTDQMSANYELADFKILFSFELFTLLYETMILECLYDCVGLINVKTLLSNGAFIQIDILFSKEENFVI